MKLFIIGNGFDLYNGYKTSYYDFKDFLINTEQDYSIGDTTLIDIFSPEENFEFWKDFEENLAKISLSKLSNGYDENEEFSRNNLNILEHIKDVKNELYSLIQNALSDFIAKNTEKKVLPKDLFLDLFCNDDKFVSFNYSETLETVYNISLHNILYIHGVSTKFRYDDNNDSIVFGHSGESPDSLYADNLYYDNDNLEKLKSEIRNLLTKYTDIYSLKKFIGDITLYKEIHIIGHSLGVVDKPYFEYLNTYFTKKLFIGNILQKTFVMKKLLIK